MRRPEFSRSFPSTPQLDALVDSFARGDYATVRARGAELARASTDPAEREAARVLVDRTRPDPLAVALLGIAAVLLVVLSAWAVLHGKAP
jgi:hypothetical protein